MFVTGIRSSLKWRIRLDKITLIRRDEEFDKDDADHCLANVNGDLFVINGYSAAELEALIMQHSMDVIINDELKKEV